jgi:hypothetical protein
LLLLLLHDAGRREQSTTRKNKHQRHAHRHGDSEQCPRRRETLSRRLRTRW